MSIQVSIQGGNSTILLTDRSVIKSEYDISSQTNISYMEQSIDTITLTGEIDLHSGGIETVNVSKLAQWAFCPSVSEDCYRKLDVMLFDSVGDKLQEIHFENAFVLRYQDTFTFEKGRAKYQIVIRESKGTH